MLEHGSIGVSSVPAVNVRLLRHKPIERGAILVTREVEHRPAVDPVGCKRAAPAFKIPLDRRFRHHHVVAEARTVGEIKTAGALGA